MNWFVTEDALDDHMYTIKKNHVHRKLILFINISLFNQKSKNT